MPARTYTSPECSYDIDGNCVRTDKSVAHKITGTMVAGILNVSPWSSPFQVACRLLGLGEEDISEKPAVKAGRILESRIIDYVAKEYSEMGLFLPAEMMFEKRTGDHASWASDFEDPVFAGHLDGMVLTDHGDYVLEVKTSGNMDAWTDGVPDYYYWQVALYNEFMAHQDEAYVVLGIVDDEDRRHPTKWKPSQDNVALFRMPIDHREVEETLVNLRAWYASYVLQGVTPPYDPAIPGDVELFTHLSRIARTPASREGLLDRLLEVESIIDANEASMQGLYESRDKLRETLKDWMISNGEDRLMNSDHTYEAVLGSSSRRSVDPEKLLAAGIDPEPYMTEKVSRTFTVKALKSKAKNRR